VELTLHGFGENENSVAFKHGQLRPQQRLDFPPSDPGLPGLHREVFEPDWLEERYPDLKGLPEHEQRRILYEKMACDAVLSVQGGLLSGALPYYFSMLLLIPAVEALAAGPLWRRSQRPWPVVVAYTERVVPLAMSLLLVVFVVWLTFAWRREISTVDWFWNTQRRLWPLEAVLAVLVAAQVATWRGWRWPLRLFLHAAWLALYVVVAVIGI
jgi:hypothetical protein